MNNVLGVINLSINQPLLHELTYSRATATVPFGGRYRLIDFVLSNMVNSGINNVAVLTHNSYVPSSIIWAQEKNGTWIEKTRDCSFYLPIIAYPRALTAICKIFTVLLNIFTAAVKNS